MHDRSLSLSLFKESLTINLVLQSANIVWSSTWTTEWIWMKKIITHKHTLAWKMPQQNTHNTQKRKCIRIFERAEDELGNREVFVWKLGGVWDVLPPGVLIRAGIYVLCMAACVPDRAENSTHSWLHCSKTRMIPLWITLHRKLAQN